MDGHFNNKCEGRSSKYPITHFTEVSTNDKLLKNVRGIFSRNIFKPQPVKVILQTAF